MFLWRVFDWYCSSNSSKSDLPMPYNKTNEYGMDYPTDLCKFGSSVFVCHSYHFWWLLQEPVCLVCIFGSLLKNHFFLFYFFHCLTRALQYFSLSIKSFAAGSESISWEVGSLQYWSKCCRSQIFNRSFVILCSRETLVSISAKLSK